MSTGPAATAADAAPSAGLRYVSDATPGIRRRRHGRGFAYTDPTGVCLRDPAVLSRIHALAIPPAWRDVWICPSPRGHLQATGRDAKGRKQYRYHPAWRAERNDAKYAQLSTFGRVLPRIRARVAADLALPGLPRERVLATVVRLLETTCIRVGHAEYARVNGSHGLTTLRDKHVRVGGADIHFAFRGKSGKKVAIDVRDHRLATIVRRCRDLPGYELFQYLDEVGDRHSVDADSVNAYLRTISGADVTAKHFRTWTGTVLAACTLRDVGPAATGAEAKRRVVEAIASVADRLGNTPTVCRTSYIHPTIIDRHLDGTLHANGGADRPLVRGRAGLSADEAWVLDLLADATSDRAHPAGSVEARGVGSLEAGRNIRHAGRQVHVPA